jgi:hypothetical protein
MLARLKKRWWLNFALIALVGALALLAVWQPGKQAPPSLPKLSGLTPDAITRARIERPGAEAIVLEKTASGWRLSAPLAARASSFNVDSLLRIAGAEVHASLGATAQAPEAYGLVAPRARLWLNDEEFAFGDLHPLNNQVYVRYRDQVYLIPGHLFGPLGYGYARYLSTRLLEEHRKPVAIKLPGLQVVLKDGSWQREPTDPGLTGDRINDFVREWQHASALDVDRYSRKPALDRVELVFAADDGKPDKLSLAILAYQPEFILYRADEGLEYRFPEAIGKRLLTLAAEPPAPAAPKAGQ